MDYLLHEVHPALGAKAAIVFAPELAFLELSPRDGRPGLRLVHTLALTQRLRDALLTGSHELPPRLQALLSGHGADGQPSAQPHLALLPVPPEPEHGAEARLTRLAIALPRSTSTDDRRQVLHIASRVRWLALGRLGVWDVAPAWSEGAGLWSAQPDAATHWATVTPLAFDLHPKSDTESGRRRELAAMVARACTHVGLPEPRAVFATQDSLHAGIPPARAFPRIRRGDGRERCHAHVTIAFGEPVMGPLLLGAGRYRGYGLLRPLHLLEPHA